MKYGYTKEVNINFEEAVEKIREELKKEGFGVLTEIDVKDTFKKKLDIDYRDYIILGACNPSFAHKALEIEKEIGLLLPCNVIVYSMNEKIFVSAINPVVAMSIIDKGELKEIANQISEKLKIVIDNI